MKDIIHLLPENISNQIAAGEVIQNPASAIKELVENAIDARADKISIIVKDAGKTLIQINDNGIGMSATDARLCFEKHATSKISSIDDLFKIKSNGFRGEALASIAAVSQVELKTKRDQDEIGTQVIIEDSKVVSQNPINCPTGTQILMKNLFYNVPARRNFLKTDKTEFQNILNEFFKLAIANHKIEFSVFHNDKEKYRLHPSSLLKRVADVFGKTYEQKLVPIQEESDIIKIKGFVCKPDAANSRSRNKQYLYVNNRYIKNRYIQHAIYSAYDELIQPGNYPFYVVFVEIDPKMIDINVHPTKQELKFEDEKLVYGFIKAAIRRSMMQYSIAPSIDFEMDKIFNNMDTVVNPSTKPNIQIENSSSVVHKRPHLSVAKQNEKNWQEIFSKSLENEYYSNEIQGLNKDEKQSSLFQSKNDGKLNIELINTPVQFLNIYIAAPTNNGLFIINQKRAYERIVYDELLAASMKSQLSTQKLLFPLCIEFSLQDYALIEDIMSDLEHLGFDISPMGNNTFAIQGTPADMTNGDEKEVILELVENFKNSFKAKHSKKETLLMSIANLSSRKKTQSLDNEQAKFFINQLFEKENFYYTPKGKPIFYTLDYDSIDQFFS